MHKYEIIIYWSNEDQVFVAEAPELPGCMAHGETEELALKTSKTLSSYGSIQRVSLATQCLSLKTSSHVRVNECISLIQIMCCRKIQISPLRVHR